jgi:hypothetical protein
MTNKEALTPNNRALGSRYHLRVTETDTDLQSVHTSYTILYIFSIVFKKYAENQNKPEAGGKVSGHGSERI